MIHGQSDSDITQLQDEKTKKKKQRAIRIPMRPFQAPPQQLDMTHDVLYEQSWIPLATLKRRNRFNSNDFMKEYKYDRRTMDQDLFEIFQD